MMRRPPRSTLSLHDALPISEREVLRHVCATQVVGLSLRAEVLPTLLSAPADLHRALARLRNEHILRSEEHTSELQSRQYLVCRLLLEKKKNTLHTSLSQRLH